MKDKNTHLILLAMLALVIVIGYLFWDANPAGSDEGVANGATNEAGAAGASLLLRSGQTEISETPTKDNVSPNFHVEEQTLRQRIKDEPTDTVAILGLARLLQDAHKPAEATSLFENYLSQHPGDRQGWLDLATTSGALQQWDKAESAMQSLLKYYPEDAAAMYNLGAIYANQNRFDDARIWWTKVQEQQADSTLSLKAMHSLFQIKDK